MTTKPYARLVDTFFRGYEAAFVLPSERESRAGFRLCLSLNGVLGNALHARLGPSREHIAVLRDEGGMIAAGMNFICFPMPEAGDVMTVHTTYAFVAPAWRGRGLLRGVYQTIEDISRDYATQCGMRENVRVIFVGEQKDPFKMTVARFRLSIDADGQNAFDRLAMWSRLGARVLLFRYVLPPLTIGGEPDSTLFLRVLFRSEFRHDRAAPAIEASMLREHLRRFFAISVAKGQYDPQALPEVRAQMDELQERLDLDQEIPALKMPATQTLAHWKRAALEVLSTGVHPGSAIIGTLLGVASVPEASAAPTPVAPACDLQEKATACPSQRGGLASSSFL